MMIRRLALILMFLAVARFFYAADANTFSCSLGTFVINKSTKDGGPWGPPQLTISTVDGKIVGKVQFALDGAAPYPAVLKYKVIIVPGSKDPLLIAIAASPGGSDSHYEIAVIGVMNGQIAELCPTHIEANLLDSLCLVTLGSDNGMALVFFKFQWEDETHYAPHRYKATIYKITDTGLLVKGTLESSGKYSSWQGAANEMGIKAHYNLLEIIAPNYR